MTGAVKDTLPTVSIGGISLRSSRSFHHRIKVGEKPSGVCAHDPLLSAAGIGRSGRSVLVCRRDAYAVGTIAHSQEGPPRASPRRAERRLDRLQEEQTRVGLVFVHLGCDVKVGADADRVRPVASGVQVTRGVHVAELKRRAGR